MAYLPAKPKDEPNGYECRNQCKCIIARCPRCASRCRGSRRVPSPCQALASSARRTEHRADGPCRLLPELPGGLDHRCRRAAGQDHRTGGDPRTAGRRLEDALPDRGYARAAGSHGRERQAQRTGALRPRRRTPPSGAPAAACAVPFFAGIQARIRMSLWARPAVSKLAIVAICTAAVPPTPSAS